MKTEKAQTLMQGAANFFSTHKIEAKFRLITFPNSSVLNEDGQNVGHDQRVDLNPLTL